MYLCHSTANESSSESVVQEWFRRVWNQLEADAIEELFAPEGVAHWLDAEPVRGPAAFREFHRVLSSSFRDIHVEVVREIQVGDLVAFQAEVRLVPVGQERSSRVQRRCFRPSTRSSNCRDLGQLEFPGAIGRDGCTPAGDFEAGASRRAEGGAWHGLILCFINTVTYFEPGPPDV